MANNIPPKVFISYSHDSAEHNDRVLALANQMRADGIDCHLDQYEMSPPEGWARWMIQQIEDADFVLVVGTEEYKNRFEHKTEPGTGLGAKWEGTVINQKIYELESHNVKFIPIVFSQADTKNIPSVLAGFTRYTVDTKEGYERLYRYLTDQPSLAKPTVGQQRLLPRRERQQLFPPHEAESQEDSKSQGDLVLLAANEGLPFFIRSEQIDVREIIKMNLLPDDARDAGFLDSLRAARDPIFVAFGNRAELARVESVVLSRKRGRDEYVIELLPTIKDYRGGSGLGEMAVGQYSPDKIAEMRARRILFNDKLPEWTGVDKTTTQLNTAMLEVFVQGMNTPVRVTESPFPALFQITKGDITNFLTYARLLGVLWLRVSGVVEHIYRLDLHMSGENEMTIDFEGQRPREYSNVNPTILQLNGICALSHKND
jgi:hypothetical protein